MEIFSFNAKSKVIAKCNENKYYEYDDLYPNNALNKTNCI